ncbi:MAG: hypothetical protein N4A49_03260 [Marinifilaceae bacterium]|nr:hypothetical protein [Marinifilaceae bacterium]
MAIIFFCTSIFVYLSVRIYCIRVESSVKAEDEFERMRIESGLYAVRRFEVEES